MMNSMIRFKNYEFEHNPETLLITSQKNIAKQNVLNSKTVVRETGDNSRIVTGEGNIYGEDCVYKFVKLFSLKEESGSGILSLPGIKPFYAFFESLEYSADPTPELISYKFVFREDCSRQKNMLVANKFYTLESGEDLWDVSYKFSIPIEKLVKLNPELNSVNDIEEGTVVRIC